MMPQKITEIYAWVCTEADGGEGIPAVSSRLGPLPLIGADKERIESFREDAMRIAKVHGFPVQLRKYSVMTVLEDHPAEVKP